MRINLSSIRIEQSYPVDAIAIYADVVVVFRQNQIRRLTCIRRHDGSWHNGCGVIPAKSSGSFFYTEVAAKSQKEAPRPIVGIAHDPKINMPIWGNGGGRGAVVENSSVIAVTRIF